MHGRSVSEDDPGALLAVATDGMTHRTIAGLLWTFLGTGFRGLLQLLVLTVLARLLTVTDFGVVTAALAIVGFSSNISSFGIGPAVVQLPHLEIRHLRAAFTLAVVLGLGMAALLWAVAPLFADFFRIPTLAPVLRVLASFCLFQGVFTVAEALLQRKMRFRLLAGLDAVTYAIGYGVVGVALALLGFGVWAFAGAHLAQAVARMVLLPMLQPHPMIPLCERRALRELLHFGGGVTIGRVGNYVAVEGDNVVVGRWLGAEALGLYGRAFQLMAMPANFIGEVLDKVLFPGMARFQDRPDRLRVAYGRGVALIALVVLPTSACLFMLAPEIVSVLLGRKWAGVVVPFQIFAVGMLFRTSYKISDVVIRAKGAVYRRAWRQALYGMLVLAGAWAGQRWGLPGVAVGVVAAIAVNFLLLAQLSLTLTGMSWQRYWAVHVPGLAVAGILAAELSMLTAVVRGWGLSAAPTLAVAGAIVVVSLLLLLRYVPQALLGRDLHWMLQTVVSYAPKRFGRLTWLKPGVG